MHAHRTTIAGSIAAAAYAAAQINTLPEPLRLGLNLTAAAGLASLGWHATDCPANCPGTDARGRRRPFPALSLLVAALLIALTTFLLSCTGCTAPNPAAVAGDTNAPAYIVSPALSQWSNSVYGTAQQVGPLMPVGPLLPEAVAGIFAIIGVISAAFARSKSREAAALTRAVSRSGLATVRNVLDSAHPADDTAAMRQRLHAALSALQTAVPPPTSDPPR